MARNALLTLHLATAGQQACCCCKAAVDQEDLELWLIPEMVVQQATRENAWYWQRTGRQELHVLCPHCVHRIDPQLCTPVNRLRGRDDAEDPPQVRPDQVI